MIVLLICSNKNSWLLHLNLTYDILFHRKMEISSVIDMKMDMAFMKNHIMIYWSCPCLLY